MLKTLLVVTCLFSQLLFGFQKTVEISDKKTAINLKDYITIYSSNKKLENPTLSVFFEAQKNSSSFFYFDFEKQTNWLKFSLHNNTTKTKGLKLRFSNALINELAVYKRVNDSLQKIYNHGIIFPFKTRPEQHRNFLVPITLEPNEKSTFLISILKKKERPLVTDIKLFDEKTIEKNTTKEYIIIGCYVGLSTVFFLLSIWLFITLKDKIYLIYGCYIISLEVFILSYLGVFQQYFLSEETIFNKYNHYVVYSELSLVFFVIFSQLFLNAKKYFPKLYKLIIRILILVVGLRILLHFLFDLLFTELIMPLMIIWYGLIILTSFLVAYQIIVSIQKKLIKNKFFLLAYSVMIFGTILMVIYHSTGSLNGIYFNLPVLLYTSFLEILLLSLALLFKVKKVVLEKELLIEEVRVEKNKNVIDAIILNNKQKVYLNDLKYLKSDGNYIEFYTTSKKIIDRNKLKDLEKELPANFVRVHKSYIVNKNYIENSSSTTINISEHIEIPLSRHYKKNL